MPGKKKTTPHPSLRTLGRAIRASREEAGYSQESFARHAGLDRSYYGAVERGVFNLTFESLVKIAAGLNVGLGELCTRADKKARELRREEASNSPVPEGTLN
jgi:transcriptional regulator with XRE-family HTH domain